MAHTKAGGSTSLGRDSQSQRLGLKVAAGQKITPGRVLVRQRGTKFHPGNNTRRGGDDTIYSVTGGIVSFQTKSVRHYSGRLTKRNFVHVSPLPTA